jgi:hypothetical protein
MSKTPKPSEPACRTLYSTRPYAIGDILGWREDNGSETWWKVTGFEVAEGEDRGFKLERMGGKRGNHDKT